MFNKHTECVPLIKDAAPSQARPTGAYRSNGRGRCINNFVAIHIFDVLWEPRAVNI